MTKIIHMTKIVYNSCFGGFGLSKAAISRGREISGDPNWGDDIDDITRTDPVLVQVVEELGKKANGDFASLAIAKIVKGTKYRIDEYDGSESVMLMSDYHWDTA